MCASSAAVRNYFKLELLIARSHVLLRQLFKNRYALYNGGQTWDDTSACGKIYLINVVNKNKKINLTPVQKISVSNGDSSEWDLTALTALLLNTDRPKALSQMQAQQIDTEDKLLTQLRDIRNKLAHHASKSIVNAEFEQLWTVLAAILLALGDIESELDKLKDDSVFESLSQSINEENTKEALRLNSLGTQAHKDGKFSEAITSFTNATVLPGVRNHDRAVFYSNTSSSRLALYERLSATLRNPDIGEVTDQRYRALQDAKQARSLWATWWKGHLRVGKVYAALNENEKAIASFERALALAPANDEVMDTLADARQVHTRQMRQEHLDPRLQPRTMDEHLNEMKDKLGVDPQRIRSVHSLLEGIDSSAGDVVKGHKYEHGDINIKQDYEQAAKYFAKAARQGNAEGIYNLARLTDRGLGVKKDHRTALKLLEEAAAQPPQHPMIPFMPNLGVAEAEHALGLRYADGIGVHKNLPTAAYWYQRGVDHGNAQSANNLALMYQAGNGVDHNLDKAQQLFELSARRGDPNAMLTLAELLLYQKDDVHMAKIWFDRACEAGNIIAKTNCDMFGKALAYKRQSLGNYSSNASQEKNRVKNFVNSVSSSKNMYKQSQHPYMQDYSLLNDHANRGSVTAKRLCKALDHFAEALNILTENDLLTEQQEDAFVHELSQCYRIEHIVAQLPGMKLYQKTEDIVDRLLRRCSKEPNAAVSRLDEDTRVCYATLHMESHQLIAQFLDQCKQKYPKSIYFFERSASVNSWLQKYEATVYDSNTGLSIDPNYIELLYFKAVGLRLLGENNNAAIEAYQAFLSIAPRDHRKVPESYYAMASCYLVPCQRDNVMDVVKNVYKQGEEAEKLQLPWFLPYESKSKTLLTPVMDPNTFLTTEPAPSNDKQLRLTNPHRIEIIRKHREWESKSLQIKSNADSVLISSTQQPRTKQHIAKSLLGLKSISLREMNPTVDRVYDGHVLSVTIIEEACSWHPSIHLVVEDEHLDCERMFIYGFPDEQGEYLTGKVFGIGSRMNIINPYLRLGASDMKASIRIDDFSSIIMQGESERVVSMCQCCGQPNASHVCARCKRARYCTKECQVMDWKLYQHRLVCKTH